MPRLTRTQPHLASHPHVKRLRARPYRPRLLENRPTSSTYQDPTLMPTNNKSPAERPRAEREMTTTNLTSSDSDSKPQIHPRKTITTVQIALSCVSKKSDRVRDRSRQKRQQAPPTTACKVTRWSSIQTPILSSGHDRCRQEMAVAHLQRSPR